MTATRAPRVGNVRHFPWTRHPDGSWSAYEYTIKREPGRFVWRLLRDGQHWDVIDKLPDAKAACERDRERRLRKRKRVAVTDDIRARLDAGDYVHAGGAATCTECGRAWFDHDVLDTPNGGWWAVACDGRLLKL